MFAQFWVSHCIELSLNMKLWHCFIILNSITFFLNYLIRIHQSSKWHRLCPVIVFVLVSVKCFLSHVEMLRFCHFLSVVIQSCIVGVLVSLCFWGILTTLSVSTEIHIPEKSSVANNCFQHTNKIDNSTCIRRLILLLKTPQFRAVKKFLLLFKRCRLQNHLMENVYNIIMEHNR